MEQWRQCGRWLIDCKVLPPNHRVVWPSAVVFDLAQALRDGVLLCQLLHNLSPGSVDLKDINFRPQMSQVRVRARGGSRDPGRSGGARGRLQAAGRGAERRTRSGPRAGSARPPGGAKLTKVPQAWGASPPPAGTAWERPLPRSAPPGARGVSNPGGAPSSVVPRLRGPLSVSSPTPGARLSGWPRWASGPLA